MQTGSCLARRCASISPLRWHSGTTFALGLIKAAALIEDGRLDANLKQRYASFESGIGKSILDGTADLVSLAAEAERKGSVTPPESSRQEYLESIVNRILFG